MQKRGRTLKGPRVVDADMYACASTSALPVKFRLPQAHVSSKGLIPDVRRKDNNIYEIVGTRRKNEKVVYEGEEAPANREPLAAIGEATITVPPTAVDTAAGLDPFFAPAESTRMNRWDYQKFTPGLERMFAPTYPTAEWT